MHNWKVLAKDHKITFINLFPLFTERYECASQRTSDSDDLHLNEEEI